MPAGLLSLPVEILHLIGPYLSTGDIRNLRLTHPRLCISFNAFLIHVCHYRLAEDLIGESRSAEDTLFVPTPDAFAPYIKRCFVVLEPGEVDQRHHDEEYQSQMNRLRREVARFSSLHTFHILWNSSDEVEIKGHGTCLGNYEKDLVDAVAEATHGLVAKVEIGNSYMTPQMLPMSSSPPFGLCTHLKELYVSGLETLGVIPLIQSLLTHHESLEVLWLHTFTSTPLSIQDVFPLRSSKRSLKLHTVGFQGNIAWSPNYPSLQLPFFPNLQDLTVINRETATSTEIDGFWDMLRSSDVQLRRFYTDYDLTESFVEFLASYQGLTSLSLEDNRGRHDAHPAAEGLISRVLPLHASTLQHILVKNAAFQVNRVPPIDTNESQFEISPSWPPPESFLHLTALYASASKQARISVESCQSLLSWLERFPALKTANIAWLCREDSYGLVRLKVHDITKRLIARTGRPWNLKVCGYGWDVDWLIGRSGENEWRLDVTLIERYRR